VSNWLGPFVEYHTSRCIISIYTLGHYNNAKLVFAYFNTDIIEIKAKNAESDTALMIAASNRHTDIVKALLEAGADVNAKNNSGPTGGRSRCERQKHRRQYGFDNSG